MDELNTRLDLQVGSKVKLKTGEIAQICDFTRPLGYREFQVKTTSGTYKSVTALQVDNVIEDCFDVSIAFQIFITPFIHCSLRLHHIYKGNIFYPSTPPIFNHHKHKTRTNLALSRTVHTFVYFRFMFDIQCSKYRSKITSRVISGSGAGTKQPLHALYFRIHRY